MDDRDVFPVWWILGEWVFWFLVVTAICGGFARRRRPTSHNQDYGQ